MPRTLRVLLVRHGESEDNAGLPSERPQGDIHSLLERRVRYVRARRGSLFLGFQGELEHAQPRDNVLLATKISTRHPLRVRTYLVLCLLLRTAFCFSLRCPALRRHLAARLPLPAHELRAERVLRRELVELNRCAVEDFVRPPVSLGGASP